MNSSESTNEADRHGFFQLCTPADFTALLRQFPRISTCDVPLEQACGRVLAADFLSAEDLPLTDRSCMDGYAVRAADTFGASQSSPTWLDCVARLAVDSRPDMTLGPGACAAIATGGSLPSGADAVVMIEHTLTPGPGVVEITRPVAPGENVMLRGEDAARGQTLLRAGRRLRVQDVGLLAALGAPRIEVFQQPRVGIVSTGDELVPVEETPRPGQVRDVNALTLACLAREAGALPRAYGIVRDEATLLTEALRRAVEENDVVLISGGSSIGTRDLTIEALGRLPETGVLAHGVAISPGKPTILARAGATPVLGLPGQIASAQVVMLVFGLPLLRWLEGESDAFETRQRPLRRAVLGVNAVAAPGRWQYLRVSLEERPGQLPLAWPQTGKSGLLRTLVLSDGLLCIDAGREGLRAGTEVDIWIR